LEEFTETVRATTFYRESFLPYSVNQRILEKEGLHLSRSDYYNLYRDKAVGDVQNEFEALVHTPDKAGFKYVYRIEIKQDKKGEITSR
jgi:hypothetical protein